MPILATQTGEVIRNKGAEADRNRKREDVRWWAVEPERRHESVWAVADRIWKQLSHRRYERFVHRMTYDDCDVLSQYDSAAAGNDNGAWGLLEETGRITLNVTQNAIDTAASMIAKNRPKTLFLTDGSDYKTLQKANKLTRYTAGLYDQCNLYAKTDRVFTDCCVDGTGALKLYADEDAGTVCADRVDINEILVDEVEGLRDKPVQMHQRKVRSRDELIEEFPEFKEEILNARTDLIGSSSVADVITVIESWHMKSGPKAKDGLHCITIENATLLEEKWDKDYYPIFFFRWYARTNGFWGRGIAQQLARIQRSINKTVRTIEEAQDMVGVPIWLARSGSLVSTDWLLNNEIARLVEYTTERPELATPPPVHEQLYQHLWRLYETAYNIVGINQSMAQGQKQPGIESGAAIREATDIASGRFQIVGQRWEKFFVDISKAMVDLSKDLHSKNEDLSVTVKDPYGDGLGRIKWGEIDLEEDAFRIEAFPVSALPSTPSGRVQTVTEWVAAGWIPPDMAMSLLQIPDTKRFADLETSTPDLVQATCWKIKDTEKYGPNLVPLPNMDLVSAERIANREVVAAKLQGAPEDVIQALQKYVDDIAAMKAAQMPPPAPPGPPQGGPMPPGQGAPPPPPPPPQAPPMAA